MRSPTRLITVGVIAAELGVPLHRVQYVLRTRRSIRPKAVAGRLWLYDSDDIRQVEAELRRIGRGGRRRG